jgi:ribosomal protein L7Ae-like RNA K-turn-binding protein
MDEKKIEGAIGLCIRARLCVRGTDGCERAVRAGKSKLILLDPAASENMRKNFKDLCEYYKSPWIMLPRAGMLESISGTANNKVLAVTDQGFAQMILKYTE